MPGETPAPSHQPPTQASDAPLPTPPSPASKSLLSNSKVGGHHHQGYLHSARALWRLLLKRAWAWVLQPRPCLSLATVCVHWDPRAEGELATLWPHSLHLTLWLRKTQEQFQ